MAFDFKKLSDVALIESPSANSHMLIEDNGVIKRCDLDNCDIIVNIGFNGNGDGSYNISDGMYINQAECFLPFESLCQKIESNAIVKIKMIIHYDDESCFMTGVALPNIYNLTHMKTYYGEVYNMCGFEFYDEQCNVSGFVTIQSDNSVLVNANPD